MLEVEHLKFYYKKDHPVLKDISFSMEKRDSLCLLGTNGTGKTSLLKCLLAIERPVSGRIRIDGVDVVHLSPRKRARYMAYVPQASDFAFSYTGEEVVIMGRVSHLRPGGNPDRQDREACLRVIDQLGIRHLKEKRFNEMSGGEKQMFLVARAMAQEARILIMDEPAASLDYANQVKMLQMIRQLAEEGYSILMTSHFPDHAFRVCSRVLLMKDGYVMAEGKPEKVLTSRRMSELYGTEVWVAEAAVPETGTTIKCCVPNIKSGG